MSEPVVEANVPLPDAPRQRTRAPEKAAPVPPSAAPDSEAEMPINFVPTALGVPVRKSLIPELYRFVRSLPADMPYADLAGAAQSAGWIWRLVERDTYASSPNLYLARFDVLIGKATADMELEHFDTISMSVPAEAPSPSLIARLNAAVTLTYMVFGRLPPQPVPQPAPQPVAPEPAPVEDVPDWRKPAPVPVEIRATRTRDGIVVFDDPYTVDGRPDDIVPQLLSLFQEALEEINDAGLVNVLWAKNAQAVEFVKDFGGDQGRNKLAGLFRSRANFLTKN